MNITNERILAEFNHVASKLRENHPNIPPRVIVEHSTEIVTNAIHRAVRDLLIKYNEAILEKMK